MAETNPTSATEQVPERRHRSTPTDLALVAAFAALISACTYVGAIPAGGAGVPITLQTLGVMLAGCVLGPVRGFLAVALYLLLGAVGLPVLAEHSSGLGVFSGPSAGYLYAFPLAAALGGLLVKYVVRERRTRAFWVFLCSLTASVLVIHPLGILGMKLYFDVSWADAVSYDTPFWVFLCSLTASVLVIHPLGIVGMKLYFEVSWADALSYDTPFWVGDLLKTTVVALVAAEVFRAFPWMQRR